MPWSPTPARFALSSLYFLANALGGASRRRPCLPRDRPLLAFFTLDPIARCLHACAVLNLRAFLYVLSQHSSILACDPVHPLFRPDSPAVDDGVACRLRTVASQSDQVSLLIFARSSCVLLF